MRRREFIGSAAASPLTGKAEQGERSMFSDYPVRATMSGLANCGRQRDNQSCCAKSFCVVDPSIICFANFRICIARPRADRRHCVRLRS
jgi:hypothetical protein